MSNYVTKTNVLSALARFKENTDALYETKADANDMKSEINQHDARLQNLEQKAGDYSIVQYRGTNAVPTGKAKYGLAKSIVGKTRAWNQLYNYSVASYTKLDVTVSINSGLITFSGTSSSSGNGPELSWTSFTQPLGHAYVFFRDFDLPAGDYIRDRYNGGDEGVVFKSTYGYIIPQLIIANANVSYAGISGHLYIRDLSVIFPEYTADQLVSMGWDTLVQMRPDLAKFDSVNLGSLVSTEVSGVKSVGVNIWDENKEAGQFDFSTGQENSSGSYWRSVDYIEVLPNTQYYINAKNARFCCYDGSKVFISSSLWLDHDYFTTPVNCRYVRFAYSQIDNPTNEIQFCLNSYSDKTTYHPHMTDTLSLSTPVTLKSAGAVAEVLDVQTGKKTRPVKNVILKNLQWSYLVNFGIFESEEVSDGAFTRGGSWGISDTVYTNAGYVASFDMPDKTYQVLATGAIWIKDSSFSASENSVDDFKESLTGKSLNYRLATPLSDEQVCDPVPDNFIQVEGGGTIETIQEQTPVIDNCLDVGYLAV